jgi:hypothetical protein
MIASLARAMTAAAAIIVNRTLSGLKDDAFSERGRQIRVLFGGAIRSTRENSAGFKSCSGFG